ncbi:hypothetical protein DRN44_01950 [Thermococci archaeon]|nr:MAG: hypothetical protein DRN44_01950 [Thermococci archaeon]
MAHLIKDFFGKKPPITKQDLEQFLKSAEESVRLEFKEVKVQQKESIKEQILKSIVGFLNSAEGEGLLIVGVSNKKEVKGVPRPHLNKEKIRNWLRDGIGSVPRAITPPEYEIVEVSVGEDEYVYLIEVHKKDDVVYFSRESGCAYIRVGDSTNKLDLVQSLELIAKKSLAKPYIEFEVVDYAHYVRNNVVSLELQPVIKNLGTKPGLYLTIAVEFQGIKILKSDVKGNQRVLQNVISKVSDDAFQITVGFPPQTMPIYPSISGFRVNGNIAIKFIPISPVPKISVGCYEREVFSYAEYEMRPNVISIKGKIIQPSEWWIRPYTTLSSP